MLPCIRVFSEGMTVKAQPPGGGAAARKFLRLTTKEYKRTDVCANSVGHGLILEPRILASEGGQGTDDEETRSRRKLRIAYNRG